MEKASPALRGVWFRGLWLTGVRDEVGLSADPIFADLARFRKKRSTFPTAAGGGDDAALAASLDEAVPGSVCETSTAPLELTPPRLCVRSTAALASARSRALAGASPPPTTLRAVLCRVGLTRRESTTRES